jgi:endonuclease YncB( thermonuclease family)
LLLLLLCASAYAEGTTLTGRVVGIMDGDTLTLLVDRTQHKIRLAQIDTPERAQPWGTRARQALSDKVFQKDVRVLVSERDRYGRLIGEIWLGDRDVIRELVREGYAWAYRDYLNDQTLLADEAHAKKEGLGLWSDPNPIPPGGGEGASGTRLQCHKRLTSRADTSATAGRWPTVERRGSILGNAVLRDSTVTAMVCRVSRSVGESGLMRCTSPNLVSDASFAQSD